MCMNARGRLKDSAPSFCIIATFGYFISVYIMLGNSVYIFSIFLGLVSCSMRVSFLENFLGHSPFLRSSFSSYPHGNYKLVILLYVQRFFFCLFVKLEMMRNRNEKHSE